MRISKEPEVRKQEIIDVAMKVFAEKGYETTTMKDIAGAAHVVPGLCYHYFQNKQQLYQIALMQYAKECSRPFIDVLLQTQLSLNECLTMLTQISIDQDAGYKYKDFFDQEGNEFFHKQLELHMSNEVFPYLEKYVEALTGRGEIVCSNARLLAKFLWGGQMAVINEDQLPVEERLTFIMEMLSKIIK